MSYEIVSEKFDEKNDLSHDVYEKLEYFKWIEVSLFEYADALPVPFRNMFFIYEQQCLIDNAYLLVVHRMVTGKHKARVSASVI